MNKRTIFFMFSGWFVCLVQFSHSEDIYSRGTDTINVASFCATHNGTADFQDLSHAYVEYEIYFFFDCEILLANRSSDKVVISFYMWNLTENDKLVVRDNYTEMSLTGKSGDKSFMFSGPTTIRFTTNDTFSHILIKKFKFLFTVAYFGLSCELNDFKCSNRICLQNPYLVCDGNNNCGDWSDEIDCNRMCREGEYTCSNYKCIPIRNVCNGYNDCGDMTDENEYVCNQPCNTSERNDRFKCKNGLCIWNSQLCNNKDDCGDWSDEINCNRRCYNYDFPCWNGRCVEFSKVCDFNDDCGDKSDESNCWHCSSNEHKCPNGLCIPKNLLCNKLNDCGDYSDEKACSSTENSLRESQTRPMILPVILSSLAIGIVFIVLLTLSICYCVTLAKRSKDQNNTAASSDQQSAPSSLIGRIRQSFRTHAQPSAPPLEMTNADERAPSLMGRIRQSFRSRHQLTAQPPNAVTPSDVSSENPNRPAIYPKLPKGVENPEVDMGE